MRDALRWLPALVLLIGMTGAGNTTAAASVPDVKDQLLAVPGMSVIEEKPVPGYRLLVLEYTQPVDHRHPGEGTFRQRLTVLHRSADRPTVLFTSGYGLSTKGSRSEPTRVIDGNQISLEHRFFTPSRPEPADWPKLDIRQAAADQHRIFTALKEIYPRNWLTTGSSKGGMTATYYERFHPGDMDGVVAYVAPNDVRDTEDAAYTEFFGKVGTARCRADLNALQREALVRRDEIVARHQAWADANGRTFATVGSADEAYENTVLDLVWAFWQYNPEADCAGVPAATDPTDDLYAYIDRISGFDFYTDQGLEYYTPYYYQAGTQLGSPSFDTPHLTDLLRHPGTYRPRTYVPRSVPMRFQPRTMGDVDRWVRSHAERMLFVYGENDPWGSEPFRLGPGARDSYVMWAPGANHGADISQLAADDRALATARILQWAGLPPTAGAAPFSPMLDRPDTPRRLRPGL